MLIAIDAHMVGERETGNETYTLNLIQALLRISAAIPRAFPGTRPARPMPLKRFLRPSALSSGVLETALAFTCWQPTRNACEPRSCPSAGSQPTLPPHASIERVRPGNALLRIPLAMPIQALRNGYDLLHVTYNAPPLCPCPTVVTIHDISFEHYPQFFSPRDRLILKTLVPLSARRAGASLPSASTPNARSWRVTAFRPKNHRHLRGRRRAVPPGHRPGRAAGRARQIRHPRGAVCARARQPAAAQEYRRLVEAFARVVDSASSQQVQ